MAKVSIIVPVYNERKFVAEILRRLQATNWPGVETEIIAVDDGSTDGSREILRQLDFSGLVIFHQQNAGKGAALKTGLVRASGEIIITQDADLEYDPADLPRLLEPILAGRAEVVYGSRIAGNNPIGHRRYYLGNLFLSKLASWLYRSRLTDIETGYKVFRREAISDLDLQADDFGIEAELTAKILKKKIKILELPISYRPRRFSEGKKISWRDGLRAVWLLFKYRLIRK